MAESYVPGVLVCEVAERHGLWANQVTRWRRQLKTGELVPQGSSPLPPVAPDVARAEEDTMPAFVPLMVDDGHVGRRGGTWEVA